MLKAFDKTRLSATVAGTEITIETGSLKTPFASPRISGNVKNSKKFGLADSIRSLRNCVSSSFFSIQPTGTSIRRTADSTSS